MTPPARAGKEPMPPITPQPGPPPAQSPAPPQGAGAAGVTPDVLQREKEYQDALRKRNQLLLDPNPVRAMEQLREATRKAADEEERLGRAIRARLALAGKPVPLPVGPGGGPGVPANPHGPSPAPGHQPPGGGTVQQSPFTFAGATLPQWRTGAGSVMSAVGQYGGRAMDAFDAATAPFVDQRTRLSNTVRSVDPTGGFDALQRLQIAMQRDTAGLTKEEQQRRLTNIVGKVDHVTLPHQSFVSQFVPEREAAVRRMAAIDLPGGREPMMPRGLPGRDTLTGEQAYREQSTLLPLRRETAEAFREEEAAKGAEDALRKIGDEIVKAIRTADANVKTFTDAAKREESQVVKKELFAKAAAASQTSTGLMRNLMQSDDDIRAAAAATAQATFRRRATEIRQDEVAHGFLREREGVASEQAQRLGGMGPGERTQGMVMLRQLQEMQKQGTDLSMMPREMFDMAASVAPETVRKMRESTGTTVIEQAKQANLLPESEYRDDLRTIRRQADGLQEKVSGNRFDELRAVLGGIVEAFKAVVGRETRLNEEFERFKRNLEQQSFYKSAGGGP